MKILANFYVKKDKIFFYSLLLRSKSHPFVHKSSLREKCPSSRISTEYGPEKLRIRTIFTQYIVRYCRTKCLSKFCSNKYTWCHIFGKIVAKMQDNFPYSQKMLVPVKDFQDDFKVLK